MMRTLTIDPLTRGDQEEIGAVLSRKVNEVAYDHTGRSETLRAIRAKLGCMVKGVRGTGTPDGLYIPQGEEVGSDPIILYSRNGSKSQQQKRLRHEMAHYLMHHWLPAALYGVDCVMCWGQDNERVRHQIAEIVAAK